MWGSPSSPHSLHELLWGRPGGQRLSQMPYSSEMHLPLMTMSQILPSSTDLAIIPTPIQVCPYGSSLSANRWEALFFGVIGSDLPAIHGMRMRKTFSRQLPAIEGLLPQRQDLKDEPSDTRASSKSAPSCPPGRTDREQDRSGTDRMHGLGLVGGRGASGGVPTCRCSAGIRAADSVGGRESECPAGVDHRDSLLPL